MQNKLALLGLFILSYLLYRRLFLVRLPKHIHPTDDIFILGINLLLCFSTLTMACIYLYSFIKYMRNLEKNEINTNNIIAKLLEISQSKWNIFLLIQNSMLALDIYLKNIIPMYDENRDYLDVIILFIAHYFCKYEKISLFIFIFIPIFFQGIVIISFFIDVFINAKFHYFYKNIWLLIFPWITTYILYSIKTFIDTNLNSLNDVLNLNVVKTSQYAKHKMDAPIFKVSVQDWRDIVCNTPKGLYLCMSSLSNDYTTNKPLLNHRETLQYCTTSMNEFFIVYDFLDKIFSLKKKYLIPFNAIKYFLYCICWAYILYLRL